MPRTIAELRAAADSSGSALLAGLVAQLEQRQARMSELLNLRELSTEQAAEFDDLTAETGERSIPALHARADQVAEQATRAARAQAAAAATGGTDDPNAPAQTPGVPRARVTSEPATYRRGGQHSYFRDLATAQLKGERSAIDRLTRNDREVADNRVERALTSVDGAGGDFVPPVWMVDQFVNLARAARTTADLVTKQDLPAGTDSINVPKILTGTAVAEQATQNTSVQNTDATTGAISAAVTTLAGQQVISLQLLEQSPVNMDDILLRDLALDYATKLDIFVINNNAAGKLGILNVATVNTVSVAVTGITASTGLYPGIANAVQLIHTTRFLPPNVIVMHPRRWAALLAAVDTSNRPLIVPDTAQGAFNALAVQDGVTTQTRVGTIQGLSVYTDPNLPTNLGAGTNQDPVIVMRADDLLLYEGTPRSEAFRETKADQLSVLLRFYNYVAFQGGRYPKSIALLTGVGLVPPTF